MFDEGMTNDIHDNASPSEWFESIGNDPISWALKAEALLTSADVLDKQFPEVPQDEDDLDAFYEFFKLHQVAMMLKGMAIECLLKSIWIARISPLVVEGKFRSIPGTKNHDLLSLVTALEEHINLNLSREESELLSVLSHAITSGRYPISKSLSTRPTKPDWVEQMKWCKWEIPADDNRFASIVSRLLQHMNKDAQPILSVYASPQRRRLMSD
jgi:hypothetical protein